MIISEQQREENFQEYKRLLNDSNYYDVSFDEQSGGVSAIHKEHQFDKNTGPFGYKRGLYENESVRVLMRNGYSIILGPELSSGAEVCKTFDGYLDGLPVEIKAIESNGRWAIRTKIEKADKQGALIIILFFPKNELFSETRVIQGWVDCITSGHLINNDIQILCIVGDRIIKMEKPSW